MSFDIKMDKGDLVLNSDFEKVTGNNKLVQDMAKMVLTTKGSNPQHPEVGTIVTEQAVGRVLGFGQTEIQQSVSDSLDLLSSLQQQQSRYQRVSPAELLLSVESINSSTDIKEPRQINIDISVQTQELQSFNVVIPVTITKQV